jgi:hypothetical protein
MSVKALAQVWPHAAEFPPRQFVILLAVADVVNDANDNLFWMASEALAEKSGSSRSTAYSALTRMVEDGWLEVATPAAGRRRAEYRWMGPPACVQVSDTTLVSNSEGFVSNSDELVSETANPLLSSNSTQRKVNGTRVSRVDEFASTWAVYPRKLNRKGAEKAWQAQRRKGVAAVTLHTATVNYAAIRAGQDPATTMHGATFYGPNDRWEDYLDPTADAAAKPRPRESAAMSKGRRALEAVARNDTQRDAIAIMTGR